eukprot:TRINITY_DN764_c0_g1_i2.p1 TRINITY_DN764_c0_g1~~TRINITY_DN764_c0_g1_i2.p1  ORF type:complete len:389 (-),score=66.10 TRINITY_DN764_c0_g1_i2:70-1236(-)
MRVCVCLVFIVAAATCILVFPSSCSGISHGHVTSSSPSDSQQAQMPFINNKLMQFSCPPLPPHTPKNVSDLKPGDIKVVMALGDSITAGYAMDGLSSFAVMEGRGRSWCIGADQNATTVYNFLKYYNPNLFGGSLGTHIATQNWLYIPEEDVLNAAQSGAKTGDLPQHEMGYLLTQLKNNKQINMASDWKMMTIFIGANDLCSTCPPNGTLTATTADQFEAQMRSTLEIIRTNIPRVFVSLGEIFNISQVYTLGQTSLYCAEVHKKAYKECSCLFKPGPQSDAARLAMDILGQQYNQRLRNIAADYAAKQYTEFAVVIQPQGRDTSVEKFPLSYLSSLDCFHPSVLGHQMFAVSLWNNLITPAAQKVTSILPGAQIKCPTADSYLYTW